MRHWNIIQEASCNGIHGRFCTLGQGPRSDRAKKFVNILILFAKNLEPYLGDYESNEV